jgi:small subunit ribosomal protein S6
MAELYDLMLLLDAAAPDERRHAIAAEVRETIEREGTLASAHDWGNRRLAFEIDHREDAHYLLLQFEGPRELLERLNSSLRIMDGVLRFRIIRQRPGGPPVPESPEPIRSGRREDETDGRVAARAAADAAPEAEADADAEPDAE